MTIPILKTQQFQKSFFKLGIEEYLNKVKPSDDFRSGCQNVSQCHIKPGSPSQAYTHSDDPTLLILNYDMTPGFKSI